MTDERRVVLQGQVLPAQSVALSAEHRAVVRAPEGSPLGLAVFGRMKFEAVRRVLEAYEQALRARTQVYDAQAEAAYGLVRREVAREQLRNIDLITGDERNRLQHAYDARIGEAEIERMRRELVKSELEEQLEMARARRSGSGSPVAGPPAPEKFADILHSISRIPNLAKRADEAKAEIVRGAGGEGNLTEAHMDLMEVIDAMVKGTITLDAESTVL